MITIKDWEAGLKAWENVSKQAEIDQEQAELYISVIKKKIEELKELEEKSSGE
jgi:hypothetical protein